MNENKDKAVQSDALVLFGITGDLAYKMIFPALYAMAKRGALLAPVIGVALQKWTLEQLYERVKDSLQQAGGIDNQKAFDGLLSLLRYVSGDYSNRDTFTASKKSWATPVIRPIIWRSHPCSLKPSSRGWEQQA